MAATPGTPSVLRAMNDRSALDLLVAHGPLTRTRIGELTGLSKPTTSQILGRLEAAGLVRTTGSQTGRPGPNALLYEIDPDAAHVAALSADPTGITAVVADITGAERGRFRIEAVAVAEDVRHRTAQLVSEAVDGALERAGLGHDDLTAAVIGTPGAIDPHSGQLRYAPHLPGWHSRTLRAELAEVLGTPVSIENDVNLAALAEQYEGAAQDHDDFVLAYVDEGVGAAIVLGGVLLRGATGGAGEIGYMPLPGAPLARGGESVHARNDAGGGFQSLVAAPAVRELAGAEDLAEALKDVEVLDEVARRLATGLAAVVAVVDPELVVLSGLVAQAGGDPLRERVERELTGLALPRPQLRISELAGDPILTGALRTALSQARDTVFDTSGA
ncbi:ROK family transcriptional regulator [Streptomyces sp. cg28]|uniref:ROK family transcriptional regulator n=1 Tax=unclassified Streptomyces TaxID=2593676 RepID=UPI000DB98EA6|nr:MULTISPECIES: ROK family transcriptional regulator [unclassified Streptomyces]MYT71323.1 ROK family protein [Streptomyces sp. SID8367]RAJ82777.1 putative NBD/HSP70 family sugar kinase [Streptomyces sp. PsTaAH-137]